MSKEEIDTQPGWDEQGASRNDLPSPSRKQTWMNVVLTTVGSFFMLTVLVYGPILALNTESLSSQIHIGSPKEKIFMKYGSRAWSPKSKCQGYYSVIVNFDDKSQLQFVINPSDLVDAVNYKYIKNGKYIFSRIIEAPLPSED